MSEPAAKFFSAQAFERGESRLSLAEDGREEAAGGAGGGDRLELLVAAHPAGRAEDQLADGLAEGDLVDARVVDVAADRDEPQAGRAPGPAVAIPLAAPHGDPGGPAEGLDVVDHRRLAVEPGDGGEGRLVPRLAPAVLHRLQQRRLLAADVAAGADEDLQVEREARAQDVVAAEPVGRRRP